MQVVNVIREGYMIHYKKVEIEHADVEWLSIEEYGETVGSYTSNTVDKDKLLKDLAPSIEKLQKRKIVDHNLDLTGIGTYYINQVNKELNKMGYHLTGKTIKKYTSPPEKKITGPQVISKYYYLIDALVNDVIGSKNVNIPLFNGLKNIAQKQNEQALYTFLTKLGINADILCNYVYVNRAGIKYPIKEDDKIIIKEWFNKFIDTNIKK